LAEDSLFNLFSANIGLYRKEYSGKFICPLCLRAFESCNIRSELTRAHIVPRSLGGHQVTLTCRQCNNTVGTTIESCEAERFTFYKAFSGDSSERVRISYTFTDKQGESKSFQAEMNAEGESKLRSWILPQASNPKVIQTFTDMLVNGKDLEEINILGQVTKSQKRANLTYLHAAFLLLFHEFGYEWALNPSAQIIREQILNPDANLIFLPSPKFSNLNLPLDQATLCLVTHPVEFRSFLVVLPQIYSLESRYGVWIPLFGCPYDPPPADKSVKLNMVQVPDHHHRLNRRDSIMQGLRYILIHFDYDPILYKGCNWFEIYG